MSVFFFDSLKLDLKKIDQQISKNLGSAGAPMRNCRNTVDGRNPAPPGMVKTL